MFVSERLFILLLFIAINISVFSCANILAVFPTPSISHQVVFRPLILELVKRGHDVTIITPDPVFPKGKAPINLTEIDVHDLSYKIWNTLLDQKTGTEDVIISQMSLIFRLLSKVFEAQLRTEEFKDIIDNKREKFDLVFIEAYVKPTLIMTHIFKVPVIQFSSLGAFHYNIKAFGASSHPLLYPAVLHQKLYNLTNLEKFQQLYNMWLLDNSFAEIEQEDNMRLQKIFGKNIPSIQEMHDDVHMLFLNNHPIWTDNQPVPPSIVYVGGIHKNPAKKIPHVNVTNIPLLGETFLLRFEKKDWSLNHIAPMRMGKTYRQELETLLNKSRNGVIYFSLGTNIKPSLLPPTKIKIMIKVFSELPYDILWKWDLDSLPGMTENIKIFKWLPQSDLLRHPKVKLFITQGGLQSTDEAIDAGVPLIGIPLLADQWYNTAKYPHLKIGLRLDLDALTEKMFKEGIENVITDKSYQENIKRLRSIVEDEPQTPLERAVWWTEYVLRHGGAKHLRAAGANMSWAQYLELELVITLVLISISVMLLLCLAFYTALHLILRIYQNNLKIKVS